MSIRYLIRVGEISLKGGNKSYFEKRLMKNIRRRVNCSTSRKHGRFFIGVEEENAGRAEQVLATTFGIVGYARVFSAAKRYDAIADASRRVVDRHIGDRHRASASDDRPVTFKISARRSDKSFELTSQDIADRLGEELRTSCSYLEVDVHEPDLTIHIEIRDRAYIYGNDLPGPGGLPVGCAGLGMLLLSGGIDSPVAGYLMAKRGLKIDALYFHTYPFTGDEAKEKTYTLSRILARYTVGHTLHVVDFADIAVRIKKRAPEAEITLLLRACMMEVASRIAERRGALALVTGESLSQVASQTVESIRFTDNHSSLPVYRPLIGYDKQEIVTLARRIGTYETSILPYDDCCTVFSPGNPVIKPRLDRTEDSFRLLSADEELQKAADDADAHWFAPLDEPA